MIEKELLTDVEAARLLGLAVSTLRKWRFERRRGGPPWRKLGSAVRYPLNLLRVWAESQPGGGQEPVGAQ